MSVQYAQRFAKIPFANCHFLVVPDTKEIHLCRAREQIRIINSLIKLHINWFPIIRTWAWFLESGKPRCRREEESHFLRIRSTVEFRPALAGISPSIGRLRGRGRWRWTRIISPIRLASRRQELSQWGTWRGIPMRHSFLPWRNQEARRPRSLPLLMIWGKHLF